MRAALSFAAAVFFVVAITPSAARAKSPQPVDATVSSGAKAAPVDSPAADAGAKTDLAAVEGDPAHDELRKLRDAILAAYEKEDLEAMLAQLHPNVVVTWQNGEVSRGPKGVREFYERMMKGDKPVVSSIKSKVVIDELAILHGGDTAIAFGGLSDDYALTGGMSFHLDSRFTATAVKEGDRWVLASYHASAGLFDNPLLSAAKAGLKKTAGVAGLGGLILGAVLGMVLANRRKH